MKYVLIITSRSEKTVGWQQREQYVREFCQAVEGQLTDVSVRYTTYDELEFSIRDGNVSVIDQASGQDLKTLHFVQFKNWMYETEEAPLAAAYLDRYQVPFSNVEVKLSVSATKLSQMVLLGENGLPVPDTFYARKRRLSERFKNGDLPEGFDYPLIMKANDGSRGDDNHLVTSAEQALDILSASDPDKQYVLQSFIPNDGDYRYLFIGLESQPLVFHRKGADGSHLNNTSKGGEGTFLSPKEVPLEYLQLARRAADLTRREIGGVDILVDNRTKLPYILEVNGTPALATGYGQERKAAKFAEYVASVLENQEAEE